MLASVSTYVQLYDKGRNWVVKEGVCFLGEGAVSRD